MYAHWFRRSALTARLSGKPISVSCCRAFSSTRSSSSSSNMAEINRQRDDKGKDFWQELWSEAKSFNPALFHPVLYTYRWPFWRARQHLDSTRGVSALPQWATPEFSSVQSGTSDIITYKTIQNRISLSQTKVMIAGSCTSIAKNSHHLLFIYFIDRNYTVNEATK